MKSHDANNDAMGEMSLEALLQRCQEWRAQAWHIGFTNGCFDGLHAGHQQLFAYCMRHCDRLIVAVNDDASVRRLKGPERPWLSLAQRINALKSCAGINAIIVFANDTPLSLIKQIRPNCLIKGGDYTPSNIVGADFVTRHGGRVHIAPLLEGYSSSKLIAQAKIDTAHIAQDKS